MRMGLLLGLRNKLTIWDCQSGCDRLFAKYMNLEMLSELMFLNAQVPSAYQPEAHLTAWMMHLLQEVQDCL